MTARTLPGTGEAWTSWLTERFSGQPMLRFVTLTFAPTLSERSRGTAPSYSRVARAGSLFAKELITSLARPSYFGVMEAGSWNGRRHLHWLISCLDESPIRSAAARHETAEGFVAVRTVESVGGTSGYVTKYVMKGVAKGFTPLFFAGGPAFDG